MGENESEKKGTGDSLNFMAEQGRKKKELEEEGRLKERKQELKESKMNERVMGEVGPNEWWSQSL